MAMHGFNDPIANSPAGSIDATGSTQDKKPILVTFRQRMPQATLTLVGAPGSASRPRRTRSARRAAVGTAP
jgi:hypothetical protein